MSLFRFTALLILLSAHFDTTAQKLQVNGWRFSAVPTSLIDHKGINLPIGVEYCFGNRFGLLLETAIPFNEVPSNGTKFKSLHMDYRARTEIRNYFAAGRVARGIMGLEVGWRYQNFTVQHGTYVFRHVVYGFTSADVEKRIFTVSFTMGINIACTDRLLMDLYSGIGRKEVRNSFSNIVGKDDLGSRHGLFLKEDRVFSYQDAFFFPAGIRIGYLLPRKKKDTGMPAID